MHIYTNQINNYINIYSKRNAKLSIFQDVNKINLVGRKVYLHVTFFSLCPLLPRLKFSIAPMVNDVLIERTHLTRMHSSRMRTARSLIISPYVVISHTCPPFTMHTPLCHACLPFSCMPPLTMHTPLAHMLPLHHACHPPVPCMPPPLPHMPPNNHACPLATMLAPQQPCTPPTMHTPWQPHMLPHNHMHPPQPCMPPSNHTCPLATMHAPQQPHTPPMDRQTPVKT